MSNGTISMNLVALYKALGGGWDYPGPKMKTTTQNRSMNTEEPKNEQTHPERK